MTKLERRQFERYSAPENTFAVFRPDYLILGTINNISKEGLLFEYIADGHYKNGLDRDLERKIDIFRSGDNLRISEIPCKIIHDCDVVPNPKFITSIPMRRCGLQFV